MKKIYSLFTLLLLSVVSFAASAKTVNVSCTVEGDKVELRDGGPEGKLIDVTFSYTSVPVEFETSLYIEVTDPELILSSVQRGYWDNFKLDGNTCTINAADVEEGDYITINVQIPKKVTVNVPDPSMVTVMSGAYGETFDIVEGANVLLFGQYDGLLIKLNDPENYRLTRVYAQRNEVVIEHKVSEFTSCSLYSGDFMAGDVFSYVIVPADEFEAPTFKVRIDEPENCNFTIGYKSLEGVVANEWTTVEMSGNTASAYIRHKEYGKDLYSVKVNGVEQTSAYGSYSLDNIQPDDEIDVKVAFPDEDYTVTIATDPAEVIGVITSVAIDGKEVENWLSGMTVHCGKKVVINFNKDLYNITGIAVNGVDQDITYLWKSYELKVTENANVVIAAEKKPTYSFILNVNNAAAISAKLNWNAVTIHDGENVVEYTSDANYFAIDPVFCAVINSLKVTVEDGDDVIVFDNYDGKLTRYLDETVKRVDVDAEILPRDKKFVVYFDSDIVENAWYYYFYSNKDDSQTNEAVKEGYNVIEFCDATNPYTIRWYPRGENLVSYLNGEEVEMGDYGYESFTFEDGDVLKMFDLGAPEVYTATFTVAEDPHFTVKKDILTTVDGFEPVSDFAGTLFTLVPDAEYELEVIVAESANVEGGTVVEANEEGNYEFVLDGDKYVNVVANVLTGIENVAAEAAVANSDVYNVAGVLVLRNATPAQLKALPAGIYVAGGKKFVQK